MARDPFRLDVFHLAQRLAVEIYHFAHTLPESERYGLQAQLRRAATSIPTNLVEGCGRRSQREYERFIDIALGSAVELRYLLDLTRDLGMAPAASVAVCRENSDHVVRALHKLQQAVANLPA